MVIEVALKCWVNTTGTAALGAEAPVGEANAVGLDESVGAVSCV